MQTCTSLWVSTSWEVGLHLRQHVKVLCLRDKQGKMSPCQQELSCTPCIKGCSCCSLISTRRRHVQGQNWTFARAVKASATTATLCTREWEMRKCTRADWSDHPKCKHMQGFCAKPEYKSASQMVRAHALQMRVCEEEASASKPRLC